jgi:hypothetical protein
MLSTASIIQKPLCVSHCISVKIHFISKLSLYPTQYYKLQIEVKSCLCGQHTILRRKLSLVTNAKQGKRPVSDKMSLYKYPIIRIQFRLSIRNIVSIEHQNSDLANPVKFPTGFRCWKRRF